MLAVTLVLMVVALTSRFIQYLGQAVAGELAGDVLLMLMFYRLPEFLLVILPLALFLGILLALGRMYAESEMVILLSSGLSQWRLTLLTQLTALSVVLLMALIALQLMPWGVRNTEALKQSQSELTEIDLIVAGQFQSFGDGGRVTYAENIVDSDAGRALQNVFIAIDPGNEAEGDPDSGLRIVLAQSARPELDQRSGARFMRLEQVLQYEGLPGRADFKVGQFDVQALRLPEAEPFELEAEEAAMLATGELFARSDLASQAELQWRLSMILLVPIVTLMAVPLSRVGPRQGRYGKLLPGTLLYAGYFVLLQLSRDSMTEGQLAPALGLWWVHLLFLSVALCIYLLPTLRDRLSSTSQQTLTSHA